MACVMGQMDFEGSDFVLGDLQCSDGAADHKRRVVGR